MDKSNKPFTSYLIEDRSYVAFVKRQIHMDVSKLTFSEKQVGEIDIVVSEMVSNLIKYAGSGELLYRFNREGEDSEIELLCMDRGQGIVDPGRMMKDGVSTSSTLGHGLGAMERLSSTFNLFSVPQWGTILYSKMSTIVQRFSRRPPYELDVSGLAVPKPREEACGDGFMVVSSDEQYRMFLGDGLGHGHHAKEAVDRAKDFFFENKDAEAVTVLRGMHEKVRRTRGLVATVAILDRQKLQWSLGGIGNILTRMYHGIEYKHYMPYNGTIGLNIPTSMKDTIVPVEKNQQLIMTSDGIKTRWELNKYPAIHKYDGLVLATCIYKDFARYTDDSSIFIAKVS